MVVYEHKGFHFTATSCTTRSGENLFLVIKMRGRSDIEAPRLSTWEYTEDEYVAFIRENRIKCAMLILDDFSMLSRVPELEMLDLFPSNQAPNHISYEPVYEMPKLRMLSPKTVYGERDRKWTEFDCGRLASAKQLEYFSGAGKGIRNLKALTGLKSLLLSGLREPDLREVVGSEQLDTLSLLLGKLESLDGLEHSKALKVLSLADCYPLRDISALSAVGPSLQGLMIDNCKNIEDFSVLGELRELRRLSLVGTGRIPSLSFLEKLPKLETLTLTMNVEDGNLQLCDRIPHVRVWPNRRHYNRKAEQFSKGSYEELVRGDEAVDEWRRGVI